jgi:hypothetical protein
VGRGGIVSLGGRWVLAAEILGGCRVGIRIETDTIMFYDLDSRELLRVRPTRSAMTRSSGSAGTGPPAHHPGPRPSRPECSGEHQTSG